MQGQREMVGYNGLVTIEVDGLTTFCTSNHMVYRLIEK
jgi:hypothetical protein